MKHLILGCFIVSLFLFFRLDANAGAAMCSFEGCSISEELCLTACSVEGGVEGTPCEWCGDFCADSCPTTGPATIIPTMGQWGMIIASILLGFFAVFAIRRRIKS